MNGSALAQAAERLVGVPFLLHGRDPAVGLDCVGVLAASLAAIGRPSALPVAYTLRTRGPTGLSALAAACDLVPADRPHGTGDVVLARTGPCQLHLLIALSPTRFVHAHAGLRRVARLGGTLPWPVVRNWHLVERA